MYFGTNEPKRSLEPPRLTIGGARGIGLGLHSYDQFLVIKRRCTHSSTEGDIPFEKSKMNGDTGAIESAQMLISRFILEIVTWIDA